MGGSTESWWFCGALVGAACLAACTSGSPATPEAPGPTHSAPAQRAQRELPGSGPAPLEQEPPVEARPGALRDGASLAHLPAGEAQWQALCSRGHADPITLALCKRPKLGSLSDLLAALGLSFTNAVGNGELGNPSFALLSHTTSLAARHVSPINPRVFIFTSPSSEGPIRGPAKSDPGFIALAFARGEPLVELVAREPTSGELRFFLVRFELGCEADECGARDLLTPAVERDWQSVSVYDGADLENTIFDCNVCHQPGGPGSPKMLRMIEQRPPWTHFFRDNEQGKLLIADYFQAHDKSETYGGIPGRLISWSEPARLEGLVEHEGFIDQPLELPTKALAREVMAGRAPAGLPAYLALWEQSKLGKSLPVPFPDYAFVEPATLAKAASAYKQLPHEGYAVTADELLDLHSEDARVRVGLAPAPELDGAGILGAMCARCHHGNLDQSLSRARFDARDLSANDDEAKAKAIARMKLPDGSPLKMPPPRFGALTEEQVARAEAALAN